MLWRASEGARERVRKREGEGEGESERETETDIWTDIQGVPAPGIQKTRGSTEKGLDLGRASQELLAGFAAQGPSGAAA
eukprot:884375-Rhodomonas_salina.1